MRQIAAMFSAENSITMTLKCEYISFAFVEME